MSPLDPEIPPAGEDIHLPGPTVLPAVTAVGITLLVIGLTTFIELSVIGGLLTILLNYLTVLPGSASTWYLVVGLVVIFVGFVMATRYR